ncbi:MAG: hypothetical protein A2V70_08430 [Planctomycetes bacterium RBG_13_63_9]|nr:MAG: hypothetical protein A2V70_08430 [Planctomycetes bacterium RBG_13_63_9]
MADAANIYGTAFKNGSATLLARVVGSDGQPIVQADIASASYTVYLLDDQDADARAAVAGHTGVALTVGDVVFNSLQTDALWTVDQTGYNFRHVLDVSENQAFAIAGRRYLVEFKLVPGSGQLILVRFRINVI